MSVLITGGLSDFANALASKLVAESSQKVVILHNHNVSYNKVLSSVRDNENIEILNIDSCNEEAIIQTLEKYQIIKIFDVSLASATAKLAPLQAASKLLLGITNVLDAVRKYGKVESFTLVSGEQVYGKSDLRDETQPLEPISFEGSGQMSVEAMVHSYAVSYRIPTVIGRIPEVLYSTADVLQDDLRRFRNDSFINILSLNDAARGIISISASATSEEPADVYNISNDVDFRVGELKEKNRLVETRQSVFTNKKLVQKIGFKTSENFMDAYLSTDPTSPVPFSEVAQNFLLFGNSSQVQEFIAFLAKTDAKYSAPEIDLATTGDSPVHQEILKFHPSHIIYFSSNDEDFEGDCFTLRTNMSTNLYVPWLLASEAEKSGIHFTYVGTSAIFGDSVKLNPTEASDFSTSALSVKAHTDKLLRYFEKTLQVRIDKEGLHSNVSKISDLVNNRTTGIVNLFEA